MMRSEVTSKIQLAGVQVHDCGYCNRSGETSISYGFVSPRILATDYEELMLQGWRRSGTYFYKPLLHKTCCPAYTIRLNIERFCPSKSQKKVLRRCQQHLQKALIRRNGDEKKGEESGGGILVTTERASFSEEKFLLYKKYQVAVHQDKPEEVTPQGFTRFLIDSPLIDNRQDLTSSSGYSYGTYHQLYRLSGSQQLIAVGVIDILPSGLSSVYCFYDEDYRELVLGKYTALKEIEFCQSHGFPFYYMGFYIHSCVKMRYKGEYKPSELLCPKTYQWFPLSDCTSLLDQCKFTPFASPYQEQRRELYDQRLQTLRQEDGVASESTLMENEEELGRFVAVEVSPMSPQEIALDLGGQYPVMTINRLTKSFQDYFTPLLEEWIKHVGNDIARRCQIMLY